MTSRLVRKINADFAYFVTSLYEISTLLGTVHANKNLYVAVLWARDCIPMIVYHNDNYYCYCSS